MNDNLLIYGAGEWNRTTDLRFTNQWKGIAQVIEDLGNPYC